MKSHVRELMHSREDWLEHLETEFKIHVVRDGDLASLSSPAIASLKKQIAKLEKRQFAVGGAK